MLFQDIEFTAAPMDNASFRGARLRRAAMRLSRTTRHDEAATRQRRRAIAAAKLSRRRRAARALRPKAFRRARTAAADSALLQQGAPAGRTHAVAARLIFAFAAFLN